MTATHTADFRRRLLEDRERILAEWQNHSTTNGSGNDWDLQDPEERAIQITSATVDRQIAEDDLNLLRKIEFALQRLAQGTYDQCANCGNPIPLARLRAKPSVSLCRTCQEIKDAANGTRP